jgi:hypothetical protein
MPSAYSSTGIPNTNQSGNAGWRVTCRWQDRPSAGEPALEVGFGRIAISDAEVPNMLANFVQSKWTVVKKWHQTIKVS